MMDSSTPVSPPQPPLPDFGPRKLLPPCRVCGDKGSGLHYGVNTCDSCKGFFQRGSSRKSWPLCIHQRQCAAAKTRKMMCATCRFQKCVDMGMSKKAIKTGRYTSEQRTKYTHEVAKLEIQAKVGSAELVLLTDEERQKELDDLIARITTSHLATVPGKEFFVGLKEREQRYLNDQKLRQRIFGVMKPLPVEDYQRIYNQTGLDIGNRRKYLSDFVVFLDKSVKRSITFIKTIPGFYKLPLKDQIDVVRGCQFECDLLRYYHTYSAEARIWNNPDNVEQMFEATEMAMFYEQDIIDYYVVCIQGLQALDLTPEEQAMLNAYLVVTCECNVSKEGRAILQSIEELICDALLQLIKRCHDQPDRFLIKLINMILSLREAAGKCFTADQQLLGQYVDLEIPGTLKAIIQ